MRTTIDAAGRVVIPKPIRAAARIEPGTELEVTLSGELIELRPAPGSVRLKKKGKLLVAVAGDDTEALSATTVNETIREVRARHVPRQPRRGRREKR
jgi:AbrB family looped-hinge helix DNA binding protein